MVGDALMAPVWDYSFTDAEDIKPLDEPANAIVIWWIPVAYKWHVLST
jgi:hypothetical protein